MKQNTIQKVLKRIHLGDGESQTKEIKKKIKGPTDGLHIIIYSNKGILYLSKHLSLTSNLCMSCDMVRETTRVS